MDTSSFNETMEHKVTALNEIQIDGQRDIQPERIIRAYGV